MRRSSPPAVWQGCLLLLLSSGCAAPPVEHLGERPLRPEQLAMLEANRQREAALAKALEGLGGAERVDTIETLAVSGLFRALAPGGGLLEVEATTFYRFPGRLRLDLKLPMGRVSRVVTPNLAFVGTPFGEFEMTAADRRELELNRMRQPLVLLKSRHAPSFAPEPLEEAELEGRRVALLRITFWSEPTTLVLDPETGRILESRFPALNAATGTTEEMVVHLTDHREVDGLVYPFAARGVLGGEEVFSFVLEEVRVNPLLDEEMFTPTGALQAVPEPPPTSRGPGE